MRLCQCSKYACEEKISFSFPFSSVSLARMPILNFFPLFVRPSSMHRPHDTRAWRRSEGLPGLEMCNGRISHEVKQE